MEIELESSKWGSTKNSLRFSGILQKHFIGDLLFAEKEKDKIKKRLFKNLYILRGEKSRS